ncbi:hypothetical protein C5E45_27385 [Nocardia nova]|uniref:Uncharacterized protein n=1 Tax=Nocardia nova TaxID=37330 RepID=A0A2S6AIX9_9NOCA|nr:hypothetical protein [Nocardia nova]PPJ31633.1 hypothetical protein C5E41_06915 [Nocardia nova]PPJ35172.1 hypothetical protein C5E45_27385 [Nocardia nova]
MHGWNTIGENDDAADALREAAGALTVMSVAHTKAVGLVRPEISGPDTVQHDLEIQCLAYHLELSWLCTLRPPEGTRDPVGYSLAIAAGMDASAIIVFDLGHVDNQPERVSAEFHLATVTPPRLWRAGTSESYAVASPSLNDCTWEPAHLERDCARRLWEAHRDCFPGCLAGLAASAALSALDEVD